MSVTTDYSLSPIIVVGANHSGTRGITDVLTKLGSKPGERIVGPYSENEFFLRMSQEMIQKDSGKGWLDSIYDVDFIAGLEDDLRWVPLIKERIDKELDDHYPDRKTSRWHWKCPSASLYLRTWHKIFPEAKIIYLKRDDLAVAESLYRRREQTNVISAVRFNSLFNSRIEEQLGLFEKTITLNYTEVYDRKSDVLELLGITGLRQEEIDEAFKRFIIFKRKLWSSERSLKTNLWRVAAKGIVRGASIFQ